MEWLSSARSESTPILDQEETREEIDEIEQDHHLPTNVVIDNVLIDMSGERFIESPINTWAIHRIWGRWSTHSFGVVMLELYLAEA
ncbi:hypothetical protein E2562_037514 [Oryza meyeriana var. granulata]|uniref:Uncharacterized protein n=1 Tax=Oryza meyeriana var. granulata TaxID=110450 RepID=A0A6G1CBT9_9ORYZ|nr:hypothetical protein E2562_037514 [Oryza meyeriana var. granulata]